MGDISVELGDSTPIEVDQSVEVISVEMTETIVSVSIDGDSPINVTLEDAQPIQVAFESQVVNWDDIAGRPTYDEEHECYIFRENN